MKLSIEELQTLRNAIETYERSAGHNYLLSLDKSKEYHNSFKDLKKKIINTLNHKIVYDTL